MTDLGLTHVALPVSNLNASIAFYEQYAHMQVVHRRTDAATGTNVAWISDHTRPFVIVLIEAPPSTTRFCLLPTSGWGVQAELRWIVCVPRPGPRGAYSPGRQIQVIRSATGRLSPTPTGTL